MNRRDAIGGRPIRCCDLNLTELAMQRRRALSTTASAILRRSASTYLMASPTPDEEHGKFLSKKKKEHGNGVGALVRLAAGR